MEEYKTCNNVDSGKLIGIANEATGYTLALTYDASAAESQWAGIYPKTEQIVLEVAICKF